MQFNNDQTIVDSGTTDIYLPTTAFNAVQDSFLQYFEVWMIKRLFKHACIFLLHIEFANL